METFNAGQAADGCAFPFILLGFRRGPLRESLAWGKFTWEIKALTLMFRQVDQATADRAT